MTYPSRRPGLSKSRITAFFSWEKAARRAWSAMAFYSNIVLAFDEGRPTAE